MGQLASKRTIAIGSSIIFALSVSACGGGGVNSTPIAPPPPVVTPPPPPPPPPPPTPPPPSPPAASFNTAEFRRSDGPSFHNATSAYVAGATGQGITVGVIDTGINANSHEYTGRVHAMSGDVTSGNRGLTVEDDHGDVVSRVIAAAKDDLDVHGIAFNATILSLRADSPGSCATPVDAQGNGGCSFADSNIANGINRAVDAGARVINISLGGAGGSNTALRNAINRATTAGIVVVVSAGNEGDKTTPEFDPLNPSPFAQSLVNNGNGLVIIATSVDDTGAFSAFSNKAGSFMNTTLSALGSSICCLYENDTRKIDVRPDGNFVTVYSGTSFSAPQIVGAAALLAQAFPNLTGKQIVNLLLTSARDAGDVGIDNIFGRGILDIARAFAPSGTLSLAGSQIQVPETDSAGILSGAMGDANTGVGPINAVTLDAYQRAYQVNLAQGLRGAGQKLRLTPALVSNGRSVGAAIGTIELALSVSENSATPHALDLSGRQNFGAHMLAGRVSASIARDTRFSLAMRQAAAGQVFALQKMRGASFLVAGNARFENGFDMLPKASFAMRHELAGTGVTVSMESGNARLYERADSTYLTNGNRSYPYSTVGMAFDRDIGRAKLAIGANYITEDETILGARFAEAIGRSGAHNVMADVSGQAEFGRGWAFSGNYRQGWTWAKKSATLRGGMLASNAFSFDVTKDGVLQSNDRIGLRVSQPLRVSSGGLNLALPVVYDYATASATYGIRTLNLAPSGREIATELSWATPVQLLPGQFGQFSTNAFWRQQPGHIASAADDFGIAFRFTAGF